MVYPQCLLNVLSSCAVGSCSGADSCGRFEEEGVSPFPCFPNRPLTSLHGRILPWKDSRNQDNIGGEFFCTRFCLESSKARGKLRRGLNRRISSFFILWHAHELDDMLGVFKKRSVYSVFFCFQFGFFFELDDSVCACVCFCIPHLSGVMNLCRDKRRNVHNTIHCNVPGKGLATCSYFLTDDPFLYHLLKHPSSVFLECPLFPPKATGSVYIDVWTWEKKKKHKKTCEFFRFPVCVSHLPSPQWMGSGDPLWQRRVFPMP